MPKRKKSITGDAARRQRKIQQQERRAGEVEEERNRRLSAMAQYTQARRAEETEEERIDRLSAVAQHTQAKQAKETEERRISRLLAAAQHAKTKRAEEAQEERISRLSAMAQHTRTRRAGETQEEMISRLSAAAQHAQTRRAEETQEERIGRLSAVAQHTQARRTEETEEERINILSAAAQYAEIKREEETEERRIGRLSTVAQHMQARRAEETNEKRISRLSAMAHHAQAKRIEETEEDKKSRLLSDAQRKKIERAAEKTRHLSATAQSSEEKHSSSEKKINFHKLNAARNAFNVDVVEHSCGQMENICLNCRGLYFQSETNTRGVYTHCCHKGRVIEPALAYPPEMKSLMDGSHELSAHFKNYIRQYNSALSFASIGAQIIPPTGRGAYCFRIHGQIYHRTSHLHPHEGGEEKYAQLYVLDSNLATRKRMERNENSECKPELMSMLDEIIRRVNPFAEAYRMMWEIEQQVLAEEGQEASENVTMYISNERLDPAQHQGRYNAPKSNEIAMVFKSSDGVPPSNRDICIYPRQRTLCRINTLNPNCDPMSYVLFFPCGEKGYSVEKPYSELQFYAHRLAVRKDIFNPILCGGKLMQQYVVDSYVKVEGNRLSYIRENQRTLRVESYLGLADHINAMATDAGVRPGVTLILPSSFIGSPRAMQQNFQDAMSIVREFGKPDLFLTFTCNPKWNEIKDNLFLGQKPHDRPDLVARVFDIKKKALLKDLKEDGVLGRTVAHIHVIEFQKRGLPHMHLLLILAQEDKIRDPETIDKVVTAELPDGTVDSRLHEIVKATMIHGPCGTLNPNAPCMADGVCTKGYPKQFKETTAENIDGYPVYRRRDNANHVIINGNVVDNRWVVPYNPFLTKKYNAHINVEICSSIKSIKYVFKYVYKGHDCAKVVFENNSQGSITWDEIKTFLDARYVSAPEAMWRLLEKQMYDKSHAIIRLPVHLPNMQPVYFYDQEERQALEKATQRNTMLTAWFDLNKRDPDANQYLYADIPKHYVWKDNYWNKRLRLGDSIVSRLYSVSPKDSERFHLRMLLFHVAGAKSFEELKTYDGILMNSFKEACPARNLLEDDVEWHNCLQEAINFQMPAKLRQLFSFICVFCNPTSPLELWQEFKPHLCEDYALRTSFRESLNLALHNIADHLHAHNMTLSSIGLPEPDTSHAYVNTEVYDQEKESQEAERLSTMLNPEQRIIFNTIMSAVQGVDKSVPKTICVNAFAGSGKSFLFNAIIHSVRGLGKIVVPVAWTGIAAVILEGGRTVHSRFKLPVPVLDNSSCGIRHNSEEGRFLKAANIIIWDECTMTPRHALNAVDRFFKDLMGSNLPFGGKVFVLGGDWRQILPVAVHANRTTILENCLKNSPLWNNFKQFYLVTNMRTGPEEQEFADWLLRLGDGTLTNDCQLGEDVVEIPEECIVKRSIVDEIFGSTVAEVENAILCPKNEDSLKINEQVLKKLPGQPKTYFSADSIVCDDQDEQDNFQLEFINSLTPSGMPPHALNLKIGAVIILLRNLNPSTGLCNGTRLIIRNLMPNVIDAEILTGHTKGSRAFIPRITLCPSDSNLPFKLQRRQFPVRLGFAMTINKSQGQSLQKVGIFLPQPVFSHGMLYVAFSRATSRSSVRVLVKDTNKQGKSTNSNKVYTKNIVFKEVLTEA